MHACCDYDVYLEEESNREKMSINQIKAALALKKSPIGDSGMVYLNP